MDFWLIAYRRLKIDFDLDAIEKEMDKMTQEMSLEEIAAMEAEVAEGFEADFNKLFNQ